MGQQTVEILKNQLLQIHTAVDSQDVNDTFNRMAFKRMTAVLMGEATQTYSIIYANWCTR